MQQIFRGKFTSFALRNTKIQFPHITAVIRPYENPRDKQNSKIKPPCFLNFWDLSDRYRDICKKRYLGTSWMGWGPVDWVERVLPEAKLKNTTTLLFEIFRFERPIPRYLLKTVLPCKALGFSYGLITAVEYYRPYFNIFLLLRLPSSFYFSVIFFPPYGKLGTRKKRTFSWLPK